jgi:hypothetical protein
MGVATHHVAHVQLGHFIISHVASRKARGNDLRKQGIAFRSPLVERQADEHLRRFHIGIAVTEFSDAALAEQLAEAQK